MLPLIRHALLAAIALCGPFPPTHPSHPTTPVTALAWLAGEWHGKVGETDTVQWHSDPQGGVIVMASKEVKGGKTLLFDFGVIAERDGFVSFVPYPHGKSGPTFVLTGFDPKVERAVFTNATHDFPKSFIYERNGRALRITLTGDEGGKPAKVEFDLRLAADESSSGSGRKNVTLDPLDP